MSNAAPAQLLALREKIAQLEAVKCRMAHERVKVDPESERPIPDGVVSEPNSEHGYVRVGFCTKAERLKRLACGHTMARYVLEAGLSALPPGVCDALTTEFREVTNTIHSLDHQKGDAEKRLARLMEQTPPASASDLTQARAHVRALEERHSDCVDRIERIRRDALAHLDGLIAAANPLTPPLIAEPVPAGICH